MAAKMTAAGAKKFALFAGAVGTTLTVTQVWVTEQRVPPVTVVAAGFIATAFLLAIADAAPSVGGSLAALVLLSSILTNGRVELFRSIANRIGG